MTVVATKYLLLLLLLPTAAAAVDKVKHGFLIG